MSDNLQKYPDPKYDVFIAHNSLDGDQVDELVQQLESRGVRVCHPARDFLAGRRVIENMASGIAESRKTITYLTKNFLASERCKQERDIAEQKAIKSKQHVIVDILVDIEKDQLPDWLLVKTYVDRQSPYFLRLLLTALEVSCPEVREGKTYDDLLQENAILTTENASLLDSKNLLYTVNTWEEKERSWFSEKQALLEQNQVLTSKVYQLEFERQQLVNNKSNTGRTEQPVRIPNPSPYQAYQTKKYELSPDMRKEYKLYYGTSGLEECQQIRERGFGGNNDNNFNSAGICFTSTGTSQVAIQNSSYGYRYIIAAKVLPGRCVQANMVTSGQGVPAGYDSVVDNVDNPSWVRIKDARQAYPEYMIVHNIHVYDE